MNQTAFLKRRRSKWADTMTLWEPVPTEEEAAGYHEQLAFEEEEEQILLGFFFRRGRHRRLVCFLCYKMQSCVIKYKHVIFLTTDFLK